MSKMRDSEVWAEMARRKVQFHANENWKHINLWGLFQWGDVSRFLKTGELITNMRKENRRIWVHPSKEAYESHIKPLLDAGHSINELSRMAGWDITEP
jgi:hypothetical protein